MEEYLPIPTKQMKKIATRKWALVQTKRSCSSLTGCKHEQIQLMCTSKGGRVINYRSARTDGGWIQPYAPAPSFLCKSSEELCLHLSSPWLPWVARACGICEQVVVKRHTGGTQMGPPEESISILSLVTAGWLRTSHPYEADGPQAQGGTGGTAWHHCLEHWPVVDEP